MIHEQAGADVGDVADELRLDQPARGEVVHVAVDRIRVHRLGRVEVVLAQRAYAAFRDDESAALLELVAKQWSALISITVKRLWHAAEVLGFDPETIAPDAVALVAATYLSEDVRELAQVTE